MYTSNNTLIPTMLYPLKEIFNYNDNSKPVHAQGIKEQCVLGWYPTHVHVLL